MSDLVWTENTKPDRPGIWMLEGMPYAYVVTAERVNDWIEGTWCFLMDLPTIADPPKWRCINAEAVGQGVQVEFRDGCYIAGKIVDLHALVRCDDGTTGIFSIDSCRILVDGQPKREPREWFLIADRNGDMRETDRETAADFGGVHVREVL